MKLDQKFFNTPIAHRGLHSIKEGFPENSIESIERAILCGYGIEVDVQMSLDRKAMVFHDYELDRLTNQKGTIQSKDATELKDINLLGGQTGIPLLSDVLNLVDGRVALLIEVKDQDGRLGNNVGDLEGEIVRLLATYKGPVAVMSFNPNSIKSYCLQGGERPVGLVTDAFEEKDWSNISPEYLLSLKKIESFDSFSYDFISHDFRDLGSTPVQSIRKKGIPILSWTIKSEIEEKIARKYSNNITFEGYMANIFTNHVS